MGNLFLCPLQSQAYSIAYFRLLGKLGFKRGRNLPKSVSFAWHSQMLSINQCCTSRNYMQRTCLIPAGRQRRPTLLHGATLTEETLSPWNDDSYYLINSNQRAEDESLEKTGTLQLH
jgi:hypothetical protein